MKLAHLFLCCLPAVCAFSQTGQSSGAEADHGLAFIRALPTKLGIEFDSPIEIDWRALAPKRYQSLGKSELAGFEKQKDMFGNTEKEDTVSITSELAQHQFCFFSSSGVVELKVETMKGVVRFGFGESEPRRTDFGYLIGTARTGTLPQGGGFVAVSSSAGHTCRPQSDSTRR